MYRYVYLVSGLFSIFFFLLTNYVNVGNKNSIIEITCYIILLLTSMYSFYHVINFKLHQIHIVPMFYSFCFLCVFILIKYGMKMDIVNYRPFNWIIYICLLYIFTSSLIHLLYKGDNNGNV